MTLQEAAKVGRPLKSKSWKKHGHHEPWVEYCLIERCYVFINGPRNKWSPHPKDFERDDFEVMPEPDSAEKIVADLVALKDEEYSPENYRKINKLVRRAVALAQEIPF